MSAAAKIPETTALGLHLLSEHRLANAHLLTPEEQADIHGHEHAGPGTIRNHPSGDRNWSITKVRETLGELDESVRPVSLAHNEHRRNGMTCPDCPTCRYANTNIAFAEMSIVNGHLAVRVQTCTCDGPFDVEGAPPHREWCGWEPIASLDELDTIVPSVAARLVREFHVKFGLPIDDVRRTTNQFRAELICEEAGEAAQALTDPLAHTDEGRAATAKELADTVIAAYGTAVTAGIDLDHAVRIVHASNMSKVGEDGKPIIRADGKVMKGPNYRAPDLTPTLRPIWSERG